MEKYIEKGPKYYFRKVINKLKTIFQKDYPLNKENLKLYFRKKTPLEKFFSDDRSLLIKGIAEALCIHLADRFKVELFDLVGTEDKILFQLAFSKSLLWRSPDSFTNKTFELFEVLKKYSIHTALDALFKLALKTEHPLNADFLHKMLSKQNLNERNSLRSNFDSFNIVNNLIEEPDSFKLKSLTSECARLYATVLIWLTTSSDEALRDRATKSVVRILSHYPEHLCEMRNRFSNVDDGYLLKRLDAIDKQIEASMQGERKLKWR